MRVSGSYDANHEYRGLESELERLRAQVLLSWKQEARMLTWLGLRDGMSVLELGSGPGFFTKQLLSLLPNSSITAVEIDPEMHQRATQSLHDHACDQLHLVEASVMDTGLTENTYDFAIARFVFQHLSNPIAAVQEALRVLKPGGKLVVIDIDAALWGLVEPYIPELQLIYQKTVRTQASRGGNRLIGRQLWRILQAAGYENLQLEAFVYHSDELGLEAFRPQMDPDRLLPAVQAGFISSQEHMTTHAAYQHFLASPNAYILMLGLMAYGEKPMPHSYV